MKKIEKRRLSFLLALVMAISLAVPAWAEGECAHEYAVTERTEPGCDESGCEVYTCALCGDSYTETLEPIHTPGEAVTENAVTPSCTEPGSHDTVIYCAVCGAELDRETAEDAACHAWNEGEVTLAPTKYAAGEMTCTCAVCGAERTETLERLAAVTLRFACDVEGAEITVYPEAAEEDPEPEAIEPEEDGSWLLLPGEYFYTARAEGFAPLDRTAFSVSPEEGGELCLNLSFLGGRLRLGSAPTTAAGPGRYYIRITPQGEGSADYYDMHVYIRGADGVQIGDYAESSYGEQWETKKITADFTAAPATITISTGYRPSGDESFFTLDIPPLLKRSAPTVSLPAHLRAGRRRLIFATTPLSMWRDWRTIRFPRCSMWTPTAIPSRRPIRFSNAAWATIRPREKRCGLPSARALRWKTCPYPFRSSVTSICCSATTPH